MSYSPRSLLTGLCLLWACGEADSGVLPENPVPKIRAQPGAVVFGRVPVGAAARQKVTLTNIGNGPASPLALTAGGPPLCATREASDLFCLELDSNRIEVGGTQEAWVVFTPHTEMPPLQVAWALSCDEGCAVSISGRGSGVTEVLSAPGGVDFGTLRPGCTAEQTVAIQNEVDIDLEVRAIELADAGGIYGLALAETLPFTLSPGQALSVNLTFTAQDGDRPGALLFDVAAPGLGYTQGLDLSVPVDIIGRGADRSPPCD